VNSDFVRLSGTPETDLRREDLVTFPASAPAAPWRVTARALFWTDRPDDRARSAIEAVVPVEVSAGATPIATLGALIRYLDTPVGCYSEIIGAVVYRRGGTVFSHIPFIAVDSPASVVGGRTNWALPKTLASFDGQPANRIPMIATGGDWRVEATPTARRLPVPLLVPKLLALVQLGPHRTVWSVRPSSYGMARPAQADVRVTAQPTLRDWFPSGMRPSALGRLTMFLGPATRRPRRDVRTSHRILRERPRSPGRVHDPDFGSGILQLSTGIPTSSLSDLMIACCIVLPR
jgi:Acetoacetate decarboxylase (ADC)